MMEDGNSNTDIWCVRSEGYGCVIIWASFLSVRLVINLKYQKQPLITTFLQPQ